jgi:competence protein ComEC
LRVHFVDVGQGDSILIQTPYGQTVLIDGGDTNTGIIQYLQSLGIQRIDLMVATHPNADHIGGLVQVLQTFPVVKVVTNGQLATTNVYENFLDAIMSAGAQYSDIKRGDVLSAGGIDFICLNPVDITNPDTNENSIVLLFSYGPTKFLLMGDAGAATEANLVASNLLSRVDILKVGHHSSTTGTTSAFLSVIKPVVAIYSAALNNSYGHSAPQTISALQVVGATIYGTDRNGTIIISADLNGYTAKLARLTPITTSILAKLTPTYTSTRATTTPGSVTLTILSVTSPVSKGSNATLSARTSPNASCSIVVSYKSGPSHASGLGSKIADSSGAVSWTWKVGSGTTSGTWPISVTCNDITQTTSFIVR